MKRNLAVSLFVVVALSACGGGGGGGGSTPAPATTAEGLWEGTTNNGRSVAGFVLDDGTSWVLYSLVGNSAVIAGAIQGSGTSQNGSFTSPNGKDFNLEGLGINNVTISASYIAKQSFNGTVTYTATSGVVTFVTSYDSNYDLTPTLTSVAGTYSGSAATTVGTEAATVTISTLGALSGLSAGGCAFSGSATPRARGNVFNVSVTFAGGVCVNGTNTVTGVAHFDAATKLLRSAALNSTRTNGFIYVGTKP
jgi:hypothetical protein